MLKPRFSLPRWSLLSMFGLLSIAAAVMLYYRSYCLMPRQRLAIAEQALASDLSGAGIVFHDDGCLFAMRTDSAETISVPTARRLGEAEEIKCVRVETFAVFVTSSVTIENPLLLNKEVIAELEKHFAAVRLDGGSLTCSREASQECPCVGSPATIVQSVFLGDEVATPTVK